MRLSIQEKNKYVNKISGNRNRKMIDDDDAVEAVKLFQFSIFPFQADAMTNAK